MCGFTLLLIAILFGRGISSQFERKFKADTDTLELVQIIFRHGDRAPILVYPMDPFKNESTWYPYADGFGALTKKGRQQHFQLGKYWRSRYEGFIGDIYTPQEIFAQSSDVDRTIMSCLADLAGMWPPNPQDPKSEWNSQIAWQPIPIHTIPLKYDNMLNFRATCPRFIELDDEHRRRSLLARNINEKFENQELYEYLTNHTGLQVNNFEIVNNLHDTLMIQKLYGLQVPFWVDSVYAQMKQLSLLSFDPRIVVPTDEAKRVKAGPLLSFLVRNMEVRSGLASPAVVTDYRKAKFYMLSGHDITLAVLLGALNINVFETQLPAYAASVILELHRGQHDRFVKLYFQNGTASSGAPQEFEIPNCGYPCTLTNFKELYKNITIDGTEWERACACKTCGTNNFTL